MRRSGTYTDAAEYGRIFRSLGDPHRIRILGLVRDREMSAGEILAELDIVQSTLSHHMKSLVEAGLVIAERRGKWTYYKLEEKRLAEAGGFLMRFAADGEPGQSGASADAVRAGNKEQNAEEKRGAEEKRAEEKRAEEKRAEEKRTGEKRSEEKRSGEERKEKKGKDPGKSKKGKKNKKNRK